MLKDTDTGSVLVVDDCPFTLTAISELLKEYGHNVYSCTNVKNAMDLIRAKHIDVVLSDIKLPQVSGISLLEKAGQSHPDIPVILMTGYADLAVAVQAINCGAFDFILKPFDTDYFIKIIKRALKYVQLRKTEKVYKEELESKVKTRTQEMMFALRQMENINTEVVQRFTKMAEYRDTDTGYHTSRIGLYSNKLAESLNMSEEFIDTLTFASAMHDIGKIAIPDNILLKPDQLTTEEFKIMKTHTAIGKKILEGSSLSTIQMAESIAWSHHEKWNGSGYPMGLKKDAIPIEGMIVMLADQYDALRSMRPYKQALSHEDVSRIITEGDGRTMPDHFSPDILKAFIEVAPVFDEIFNSKSDVVNTT